MEPGQTWSNPVGPAGADREPSPEEQVDLYPGWGRSGYEQPQYETPGSPPPPYPPGTYPPSTGHPGGHQEGPAQPFVPPTGGYWPPGYQRTWGTEPPGWGPPPASPSHLRRRRTTASLFAGTALAAALIGAVIGSQLDQGKTATTPAASSFPSATLPPQSGSPTNPGLTNPFANPGNTSPSTGSGLTPSGSTGTAVSPAAAAIATATDPGLVDVNTVLGYQNGAGAGTGMILNSNGEILTNNHVVDGATRISVTLVATGKSYRASVVGTDPTDDIAIIQIQGTSGLHPVKTGNSTAVATSDSVVAIGNAGGTGGTPSVVTGTVTAVNQTITASDANGANPETLHGLIQTNAPIQPGDSGGPLVNSKGEVVGIDTAASAGMRLSADANLGFAIPIAHALTIANQIESGQASATVHLGLPAFLGVAVQPSGQSVLGQPASNVSGAVVANAEPGLPAANAGISSGDVITSVGGKAVDSPTTLSTLMRTHKPGDKVSIGWTDPGGAAHTATITLATGPAD
ncbi:MAG: S1C family serine protease [Actinomycetota bacterium]|nr:S1C family serine protease [Actinomycetota bacterium]